MKLFVSYDEAQASIRRTLNLTSDIEIVIGRKASVTEPVSPRLSSSFLRIINFIDQNYEANKISAIKFLRENARGFLRPGLESLGLREAKDIVENWNSMISGAPGARKKFLELGCIAMPVYNKNGFDSYAPSGFSA